MAGSTPSNNPVYLWRETHENWGFLSQWYHSPFYAADDDIVFSTAEQWMMYRKAMFFGDKDTATEILATDKPRQQKSLGRKVKNFDSKTWDKEKLKVVEEGSYLKFTKALSKKPDLKAMLLATGDRPLVEASPFDRIWGIGYTEKDAEANRQNWGQNLLGAALETTRTRIRQEEASTAP